MLVFVSRFSVIVGLAFVHGAHVTVVLVFVIIVVVAVVTVEAFASTSHLAPPSPSHLASRASFLP